MMAMARLDIPSVFVYGGSILPGHWKGEDIQIQTVFEAVGQIQAGQIDEDELYGIESNACPGPRIMRRNVHRQYHVFHRRGTRTFHTRCCVRTKTSISANAHPRAKPVSP